ncbi:fructosamine kinase family protein [Shimazuella sp. AN120528]|uniref:fructosamine kinase family protein n=1 Tax=Shimazuella soli TaxID=1892854 RepID=UPI001F0CF31E|nr:fructosamine kinase family protein [Shimazuella soli]MCH5585804.1 fructosamine kinase family protein [Shimazuella soli]
MTHLLEALRELGDRTCIREIKAVSGGSINQVTYVETDINKYIVKAHTSMPENFFIQEAMGLSALSCCVRVPKVFSYQFDEATGVGNLWLEWIPAGVRSEKGEEELGRKLGLLHQTTHAAFGFVEDNYLGIYPQPNAWSDDWISFFRDKRLQIQKEIALEKGYLCADRLHKLEKLMDRLEDFLPAKPISSLLHGDMWSGNTFISSTGEAVFIDPSVNYGDREVDIAMTELFGGFSPRFYQAYEEINPIEIEYNDRKGIYQLYYLLVYLNYFGESYGEEIDKVLGKYI